MCVELPFELPFELPSELPSTLLMFLLGLAATVNFISLLMGPLTVSEVVSFATWLLIVFVGLVTPKWLSCETFWLTFIVMLSINFIFNMSALIKRWHKKQSCKKKS